jgi:hypothetical protein
VLGCSYEDVLIDSYPPEYTRSRAARRARQRPIGLVPVIREVNQTLRSEANAWLHDRLADLPELATTSALQATDIGAKQLPTTPVKDRSPF